MHLQRSVSLAYYGEPACTPWLSASAPQLPACAPQPCPSDRHQRGRGLMLSVFSGLTQITAIPAWDCLPYLIISIFPPVARKCCRVLQNFSFLSISPFSRHSACLAACRYLPHECELPEKYSSEGFFCS